MTKVLKIGDKAPDFTLKSDGGHEVTLSKLKGKNVVLYFYPKDDTPGCTLEAKEFSEKQKAFSNKNAVILGVSKDNVRSHDKFKEKCNLSVTLLSDEDGKLCEMFGVWIEKSMYGKKYMGIDRSTFIISPDGTIIKEWRKVSVTNHVAEVLEAL